jgi:hypothetical protein
VPLRSLPAYVPQAFLAVEDKRFYKHNGVDWGRVLGAALANVKAPVVGFYAGNDARINNTLPGTEAAMKKLGKSFVINIYGARATGSWAIRPAPAAQI